MTPHQSLLIAVAVLIFCFICDANLTSPLTMIVEQRVHGVIAMRNTAQGAFHRPFFLLDFEKIMAHVGIYSLIGLSHGSVK
jgi:hypothetical protein